MAWQTHTWRSALREPPRNQQGRCTCGGKRGEDIGSGKGQFEGSGSNSAKETRLARRDTLLRVGFREGQCRAVSPGVSVLRPAGAAAARVDEARARVVAAGPGAPRVAVAATVELDLVFALLAGGSCGGGGAAAAVVVVVAVGAERYGLRAVGVVYGIHGRHAAREGINSNGSVQAWNDGHSTTTCSKRTWQLEERTKTQVRNSTHDSMPHLPGPSTMLR